MHQPIYITSLHLRHGGVEMMIASLANAFSRDGYPVEILCTYNLGEPAYPLDPAVRVRYLTDLHPNREAFQAALAAKNPLAILREGAYAVRVLRQKKRTMVRALAQISEGVIIATRNEHAVLLSRHGQPGVRKIAQLHHDHRFDPQLRADFQRRYGRIDVFALLTEQLTEEVRAMMAGHNPHTRCVTLPNFLAEPYAGPELPRQRQVVAVGRLSPEKGFDRLLRVWSMAAPQMPDWRLMIIGGGGEQAALQAQAERLGVAGSVTFTGMMDHDALYTQMAQSQICAMTSHTEAFPMVLLEAQSCGLPVIAFDVRVGPRAIVNDGVDGRLIPDGQEEAFAQALADLARDEDRRQAWGRAARSNAQRYAPGPILAQWYALFTP